MRILVTGAAGFIGYHVVNKLADKFTKKQKKNKNKEYEIVGLDSINSYYDPELKVARLRQLGFSGKKFLGNKKYNSKKCNFLSFYKTSLEDQFTLERIFRNKKFDVVCHLAAQAGVRYSMENPNAYVQSNIVGFQNILEACRKYKVNHLVYASSSSVYGNSDQIPFSVQQNVDHPVSVYAASKKSNELWAHVYSHLYKLKTTGLRFFTVYGPWGRPDMAYFSFTQKILAGHPIQVFNHGNLSRDFTYIDDIVSGILKVIQKKKKNRDLYKVYNIGNTQPVNLLEFIRILEKDLGLEAKKQWLDMQPGDVERTWADVEDIAADYKYKPKISLAQGIRRFVKWYISYYNIDSSQYISKTMVK